MEPINPQEMPRHSEADRPFEETKQALHSAIQGTESMDPAKKAALRSHVISITSMSSSQAPQTGPVSTSAAQPPLKPMITRRGGWFMFGGFATMAAAIALVFFAPANWFSSKPQAALSAFGHITVPEALAADAFKLTPLSQDALGVDTGSGWKLTSKLAVSTEMLKQTLTVLPAVEVAVNQNKDGSFIIQPKHALKPGELYQVSVATDIAKTDGSVQPHTYQWALQTKSIFDVISTVPGTKVANVPTNTGIEFTFTHEHVKDLNSFFSIKPTVKGRFEAHGRAVAFVPERELASGTRYVVTLKKGLGVEDSSLALDHDVTLDFETTPPVVGVPGQPVPVRFQIANGEFQQGAPKKELFIAGYTGDYYNYSSGADVSVEATGYAVSYDDAKRLVNTRRQIPYWTVVEKSEYAEYEALARTTPAFRVTATTTKPGDYQPNIFTLPPVERPGSYVVRFQPTVNGTSTWMLIQVTTHAAYATADSNSLYAWVIDQTTSRPLSNMQVAIEGQQTLTDSKGVAKLGTNQLQLKASSTRSEDANFLMEIGSGEDRSFVPSDTNVFAVQSQPYYQQLDPTTAHYLMTDRPIYHMADEANVFGFVQDRLAGNGKSQVTIRLSKSMGWYGNSYDQVTAYDEQTVSTDDVGAYKAKFSWKEFVPGWYTINAYRNDKLIGGRSFEIRDFVKPAYTITLNTQDAAVFAGDTTKGTLEAQYYDGTPFAHASFKIQTNQDSYTLPPNMVDKAAKEFTVTTDDLGKATFDVRTESLRCFPLDTTFGVGENWCSDRSSVSVQAVPAQGEQADISASTRIDVYGSELGYDYRAKTSGTNAMIDIQTLRNDPKRAWDQPPQAYGNRVLDGVVQDRHYERQETGNYYDFIEKKFYPTYYYNLVTDSSAHFKITTDASGKARYAFQMRPGHMYQLVLQGTDDKGRPSRGMAPTVAPGWYDNGVSTEPRYSWWDEESKWPSLDIVKEGPIEKRYVFSEGETVHMRYMIGKNALAIDKTPGIFYVVASNGIQRSEVVTANDVTFGYDKRLIPSAEVDAVTFINGDFQTVQQSISIDTDTRQLDLDVRPDKKEYRPGDRVTIQVTATRKEQKTPAKDARILVSSIDRALQGVTMLPDEMPLGELYAWVPSGIIFTLQTHSLDAAVTASSMAEKGGGGGDGPATQSIRRTFKDTAAFETAITDNDGHATISFTAPDNLTTWKTTVVGITPDVYAGSMIKDIIVTKPVFVDVVVPSKLLTGDKPTIMLRAHGRELQVGSSVTYTVSIPSLGVDKQVVQGKAFEPTYLGVPKLIPGTHTVTIFLKTPNGEDALEQKIYVLDTHYTSAEQVDVDATVGGKLPLVDAAERTYMFTSKTRGSAWNDVVGLWYAGWSPRLDARIARRVASNLLHDVYHEATSTYEADTDKLTGELAEGGMRLFPYASSDILLASNAVATQPEAFDSGAAIGIFRAFLATSSTREQQIAALAGLAAYKDPVLLELREMRAQKDLNWHEKLLLARGFALIGDQSTATDLLNELLEKADRRDGLTSLVVNDRLADRLEASAEAAAIAVTINHPEADHLMAYVRTNWSNEAFPVLAKARYLKTRVPTLPYQDVKLSFTYTSHGEEKKEELSFREWPNAQRTFTREEAASFTVTSVTGPVTISTSRVIHARPAVKPEISLTRTYESPKPLADLKDGDEVTVHLHATWQPTAQEGCYAIKDYLPGNTHSVKQYGWWGWEGFWGYQQESTQGEMTFTACTSNERKPVDIQYQIRISARGSYLAEAPLMQHLDYPSIATMGSDQVLTIK